MDAHWISWAQQGAQEVGLNAPSHAEEMSITLWVLP
ncbi:hypothetical protein GALL_552100 [mine drainage metagenome]|uniref:Uncharacterized protein n=1 Tax=mine drainage metagenome TaxID=410659 RepID=A0A1J5NWV6_9ZZZZ